MRLLLRRGGLQVRRPRGGSRTRTETVGGYGDGEDRIGEEDYAVQLYQPRTFCPLLLSWLRLPPTPWSSIRRSRVVRARSLRRRMDGAVPRPNAGPAQPRRHGRRQRRLDRSRGYGNARGQHRRWCHLGARSLVAKDVPPYGQFDDADVRRLLSAAWWDWPAELVTRHMRDLIAGTPRKIEAIAREAGLLTQ